MIRKGKPPVEGEDTTYVMSRSEDRSLFVKAAWWTEKYRIVIWPVVIFLLAAGFDFKTPKQIFHEIYGRLDSLEAKNREAITDRKGIEDKIDALIRLRCFELQGKNLESQALLAGLDCNAFIRGR